MLRPIVLTVLAVHAAAATDVEVSEPYRGYVIERYSKCESHPELGGAHCCSHGEIEAYLFSQSPWTDFTASCTKDCPNGRCRGGEHVEVCPKGFFCPPQLQCAIMCTPGTACPGGCGRERECPAGHYCSEDDGMEAKPCPKGHYCRKGSSRPTRCSPFTICPAGTTSPQKDFTGGVLVFCIAVAICLSLVGYEYRKCLAIRLGCYRPPHRSTEVQELVRMKHMIGRSVNSLEDDFRDEDDGGEKLVGVGLDVPKQYTLTIEYKDVNLKLRATGKTIVSGATGKVAPGRVTAIMGPSGSGKTSLLAAITGKNASRYEMSGSLTVNGVARGLGKFGTDCGFVPQDDVVHSDLRVREALQYQAELRLPLSWSRRMKMEKTASVIKLLGLEDCMNSIIGDAKARGISGGQRKRVNVGMELVADPTFIALDEPTSGLDSTSSLQVIRALKRVTVDSNLTTVAVLHQPRYEIFEQFDDLLLLVPGGLTAYMGPVSGAVAHFENLGFHMQPHTNPADFILDVVSGVCPSSLPSGVDVVSAWANRPQQRAAPRIRHLRNPSSAYNPTIRYTERLVPGWLWQTWICFKRELVRYKRAFKTHTLDIAMIALGGACLGGNYMSIDSFWGCSGMMTMSSLILGLSTMIISLRPFGAGIPVLRRELESEVRMSSHFLAVNLVQLPMLVLVIPAVYLSIAYAMLDPRFSNYYFFLISAGTTFACSGVAYLISAVLSEKSAQIVAVVWCLASAMFSGSNPSIPTMDAQALGPVLYRASFARWAVEAIMEQQAYATPVIYHAQIAHTAMKNGYGLENHFFGLLGMLVAIGVIGRAAALCIFGLYANRARRPLRITKSRPARSLSPLLTNPERRQKTTLRSPLRMHKARRSLYFEGASGEAESRRKNSEQVMLLA